MYVMLKTLYGCKSEKSVECHSAKIKQEGSIQTINVFKVTVKFKAMHKSTVVPSLNVIA